MTIENLKQIAIKYATTKGSRVPLAPDELCNAVVQYFNEFLKITADINTIQVAVTEEGGNIVFTITGNTLDGKAFTPIVITVDHNDFVTNQEFEEFKTSVTEQLNNKLNKITSPISNFVLYGNIEGNDTQISFTSVPATNSVLYRDVSGKTAVVKGASGQDVANMENIADLEEKIPSITNLADVTKENTFTDVNHFTQYITTFGVEIGELEFNDDEYDVSISNATIEIFHYISGGNANSIRITDEQIWVKRYDASDYNSFDFPNKSGILALTSDIPDTSSFVTLAGDNTFGGTNTFNNSIYAKNGVVAGDTTNYGANSVTKGSNTYSFPNKSGTFAMTTDVIKNPIYFISFYANDPSEPCHLIGTMMSKNSYGTGKKTNEEFAVMLADNLYTNSNEGLAAYGKLAKKDILCIYSEDGLSIRCLDEENSEVDLPTVMFFVMETEL